MSTAPAARSILVSVETEEANIFAGCSRVLVLPERVDGVDADAGCAVDSDYSHRRATHHTRRTRWLSLRDCEYKDTSSIVPPLLSSSSMPIAVATGQQR